MIIRSGRSNIRSTVVSLAVAAMAVAGLITVGTGTTTATAAAPPPSTVEDEGANCPVSLPGSLTSNAKLPDPFKKLDGTRITSTGDWRCRREEIKQLAEKYVYGTKPGKPSSVTGTVSSTNITVNVSEGGKSSSFSASVSLPSGTGPFPSVIVYGGFGADTATIKAAGAAVISYDPYSAGKEGTGRASKQGAFYSIYGSNSTTGLLQAWGWGVSRIIDVINSNGGNILKGDSVGVTGCSRFGKGAFVAGVFDQRVALTMPIESGSAGVPIFRGIPGEGAQSLSSAYGEQPWFGDAFSQFTSNPNLTPVDTHEMVAMVAPRGLFIMDNPHIANLGPKSGSVAALGGNEVYKALGAGDNITYWSDISDGNHCALRPEWKTPLTQTIQKFLLRTGNAAGAIRISGKAQGDLAGWRDWTTPTLSNTNPTTPPPTTTTAPPTTTTAPPITTTTAPPPTTTIAPPPTTTTTPPPPPTTTGGSTGNGCTATYTTSNSWSGGYVGAVKVSATSATNTWKVVLTLPSGTAITNIWNGNLSGTTVTNATYNGKIPAGGSTDFGFQGTGSASGITVAGCTAA